MEKLTPNFQLYGNYNIPDLVFYLNYILKYYRYF
jgi:hypothetical protein